MTHHTKAALLRGSAFTRHVSVPRADGNDPASLVRQLNAAFEEFKKTNDERIKGLESGKLDALVTEKTEKVNAAISDVQAELDRIAKESARSRLVGSGSEVDLEAQAMAFRAARAAIDKQVTDPDSPVTSDEIEQVKAYQRAFNAVVRRHHNNVPESVRAELSIGQDSSGGFVVPPTIAAEFQRRAFETSDIRPHATVVSISSDRYVIPVDVEDAETGGWVSERQERTETDTPGLGEQRIDVHEQYAEPRATQRLLDDAAVDIEGWLSGKLNDKFIRVENAGFITANGVGKPKGFLAYAADAVTTPDKTRAWGKLQYVPSGADGAFKAVETGVLPTDPLIDLIQSLKPMYRNGARFAMNRLTTGGVRKLKDGDGNYIWQPSLVAGQAPTLLGYEVSEWEDMPDVASGSFAIAFGDFRGYTIVDRAGITVLRDPYTKKGFVKFYTTRRVGGDVTDFDAIKLMKFSES